MNSFWNRATIIETERKNFDSSMRLIDAVVSRINAMNIASEDKEKIFKKLTEDLSGNGIRSLTTSAGRGDNGIPYTGTPGIPDCGKDEPARLLGSLFPGVQAD